MKRLYREWQEGSLGGGFLPISQGKGRDLGAAGKGRWMSSPGAVREPQLWGSAHVQGAAKLSSGEPTRPLSIRELSRAGGEAQDLLR